MSLKFLIADKSHIDEIYSLFRNAICEMNKNGIYQWDEIYPCRDDIEKDIEQCQMYIAMSEDAIAAVYVINFEYDKQYNDADWEYSDFIILHRLCVNPDFQHRGIAAAVLNHIEAELKTQGIQSIRLDVFSKNPYALKLYEKAGYKKTGTANFRKGLFYLMEKTTGGTK